MTVKELRELIIECLLESGGDLVGRIPLDVLKQRSVPSSGRIKLGGFRKEIPDPVLQKELDSVRAALRRAEGNNYYLIKK